MIESLPIKVFVTERGKRAGVTVPQKANPTDSGHDIKAPYGFWLWPSVFGCKKMWTGLDIDIPLNTFTAGGMTFGIDMEIEGRTSRQLKLVEPGPKIFDRTYRVKKGDPKGIVIGLKNMRRFLPYYVQKHEKVAQLIFRPFLIAHMVKVGSQDEIHRDTEEGFRGAERFGGSDKRDQ